VREHLNQKAGGTAGNRRDLQSTVDWRAIEEEFLLTGQAAITQNALTLARDRLVVEAFQRVIGPVFPRSLALLACGPYGLSQTFPHSELDIVLLLESEKQSDALKELLPEMVRLLWNAGLRVNSPVLTIAECLEVIERASVPAFTLFDRRLLAGDRTVHEKLDDVLPGALALHATRMRQRLCELAHGRHARYQNTPFHSEPDVKQGPGGLQDVRLIEGLLRLNKDSGVRVDELHQAARFVASARCFLQYRAACDHNILDSETQASEALQAFASAQGISDWVSEFFHCAGTIFNEARRAVEGSEKTQSSLLGNLREHRSKLSNQEFTVLRERLQVRNPAQLASEPALVFRTLEFIGRHGVMPSPETGRDLELARDTFAAYCAQPQALWPTLKAILACPHAAMALRTLAVTGLMRSLFPPWARIEYLVVADYRYTIGEQALRAIERAIELGSATGPERQRFAGMVSEIEEVTLLLFALLFHDMGRGNDDPVECSLQHAREAMTRMQMPVEAQRTVEFLIRHASDLSDAAGQPDDDSVTARLLAERVGTIERLKLLSVMTYARLLDLSATADVDQGLDRLWHICSITEHELTCELQTDRIEKIPEDLPANAEFIKGFPLRYLRAHSAAEIAGHLRLFELSRPTGVAVKLEPTEGCYRLTVVARDKPFLFASFAGAISSFGLDITKAEAFSNASGVLLDMFAFADPKRVLRNPGEADRLSDLIQRLALGKADGHRLMKGGGASDAARKKAALPLVQFDSEACPRATLVEVQTQDRPGLLYNLATVFSSSACNIDVVLVDTKGQRAIDVFYVAHEGRKLSPDMQVRLKEKLLAVC
jgi:[protein-PII] uridylyltransferase